METLAQKSHRLGMKTFAFKSDWSFGLKHCGSQVWFESWEILFSISRSEINASKRRRSDRFTSYKRLKIPCEKLRMESVSAELSEGDDEESPPPPLPSTDADGEGDVPATRGTADISCLISCSGGIMARLISCARGPACSAVSLQNYPISSQWH